MKIAVVGSRDFIDYAIVESVLNTLKIVEIISGGARGADSLGARYADEHAIPLTVFPAEWDKYGRAAGIIRNRMIVESCNAVIAFWDGKSPGTRNTIAVAKKNGKEIQIVNI